MIIIEALAWTAFVLVSLGFITYEGVIFIGLYRSKKDTKDKPTNEIV